MLTMLTAKQRLAIESLVPLSDNARALSNSFDPAIASSVDVAALKQQLVQMHEIISDLQHQMHEVVQPEDTLNDEQAYDFSVNFASVIKEMTYRALITAYDRNYLIECSKQMRLLVCTALVNSFQQRAFSVPAIWEAVIASNGHLN